MIDQQWSLNYFLLLTLQKNLHHYMMHMQLALRLQANKNIHDINTEEQP